MHKCNGRNDPDPTEQHFLKELVSLVEKFRHATGPTVAGKTRDSLNRAPIPMEPRGIRCRKAEGVMTLRIPNFAVTHEADP